MVIFLLPIINTQYIVKILEKIFRSPECSSPNLITLEISSNHNIILLNGNINEILITQSIFYVNDEFLKTISIV